MMKRITAMLLALLLVLTGVVVAQPAQAQEAGVPEHNVQPEVGAPDTTFAFYATGFYSEETVHVWVNDPAGNAMEIDVDELYQASPTGRADWYWNAPDNAAPGHWQMIALGDDSNVMHVINFQIQWGEGEYRPPDTEDLETYSLYPEVGYPGSEIAFYATGFDVDDENPEDPDYERVEVWVETPSWRTIDLDYGDMYVAPPSGRVDWTWTVPMGAESGVWHMVIFGHESELKHVIPFEVRAP
jgi:hypothetical protein